MVSIRMCAQAKAYAGSAALLAAAACASGDSEPAPLDVEPITAEAMRVIGRSESLARVQDVKLGTGDTIWVLNSADPFLVAFAPDGGATPVRAWGRAGEGPQEFGSPTALGRGPGGSVWTFDQRRHALIRVNGSEDDWVEIPLPRDSLPPGRIVGSDQIGMMRPWMSARADGFVFAVTSVDEPAAPRMWNARLVSLEPGNGSVRTIFSTAEAIGDPATRWPSLTILMPHPLWDVCADGTIVAYDPLRNAVVRFEDGHAAGSPTPLPPERATQVTPERTFQIAYRDAIERVPADRRPDSIQMLQQFESEIQSFGERFGTIFPEYADLRCALDGQVWIQLFDVEAGQFGKGRVWLRAKPGGSIRGVRMPDGFTPYQFLGDRVLGVLKDEYDVASIVSVDIG